MAVAGGETGALARPPSTTNHVGTDAFARPAKRSEGPTAAMATPELIFPYPDPSRVPPNLIENRKPELQRFPPILKCNHRTRPVPHRLQKGLTLRQQRLLPP